MTNKIIFLILFVLSVSAISAEKTEATLIKIQGSKDLPIELNLLLENLQNYQDAEQVSKAKEQIMPFIEHIDAYAKNLTSEDIFLVGKIAIYKTLLNYNNSIPKASVDIETLKTLESAIKKSKDSFTIWFLESIHTDIENLINMPAFKEYLIEKNNGRLETAEIRKIDRKVQLLYRWASKINPASSDFEQVLKIELKPVLIEALKNIEQSFFLMQQGRPVQATSKELKFFSLKEIKIKKKAPKKLKTVEEILSPLTNESTAPAEAPVEPLPKPSEENWLKEENPPATLKNLPKPSGSTDWLQDI